jgi:hypothetical protein
MSDSISIYSHLVESTSRIQRHFGQAPLPDPALRAFCAALLRDSGFLGTGDQAAVLCGVSRVAVHYSRILLANGDMPLVDAVLTEGMSLREAASSVRRSIKLLEAYADSSPADNANLGATIGPEKVFDEVVVPALEPTTNTTVVLASVTTLETTTPKANGKTTNDTGQLYSPPVASPTINVSKH